MRLRYNGVKATLSAAITSTSATTMDLSSALTVDGTNLVVNTGDYLPVSLLDVSGVLREVVYITGLSAGQTTSVPIARGQEGTSAKTHAVGALLRHGPLAGDADLSANYVGTSTTGTATELFTSKRVLLKKVVLAQPGLLTDIGAYVNGDPGNVDNIAAGLWADNAGTPSQLIAANISPSTSMLLSQSTTVFPQRWFTLAIGRWLDAGTYWIGVSTLKDDANIGTSIAYTTGGSDVSYTPTGTTDNWLSDATYYTNTNTTKNYSIRANVLSAGVLRSPSNGTFAKVLLKDVTLASAAASIDLGPLPTSGYRDLEVVVYGRSDAAAANETQIFLSVNGDTTDANYASAEVGGQPGAGGVFTGGSNASRVIGHVPAVNNASTGLAYNRIIVADFLNPAGHKYAKFMTHNPVSTVYNLDGSWRWRNNAAITSAALTLQAGNFTAGTRVEVFATQDTTVAQPGAAKVLLKRVVLGSDTTTVSLTSADIPSIGYRDLEVVVNGRSTAGTTEDTVFAAFNGDTTDANYIRQSSLGVLGNPVASNAAERAFGYITAAGTSPANQPGVMRALITDYAGTAWYKQSVSQYGTGRYAGTVALTWKNPAAITSIDLTTASQFKAGTVVSLYGTVDVMPQGGGSAALNGVDTSKAGVSTPLSNAQSLTIDSTTTVTPAADCLMHIAATAIANSSGTVQGLRVSPVVKFTGGYYRGISFEVVATPLTNTPANGFGTFPLTAGVTYTIAYVLEAGSGGTSQTVTQLKSTYRLT